ncbi:MAG: hypothetical protein ACPHN3_02340 [Spongiibacter sp.]|uniref:Uncharacterized protein n=1 Tax=Spongiibacter thalassae TaxID=2721624 RepID=A0ABX1GKR2_9GAMM|nr:hypothetical protein [Spongiibacter thalassae]NKI19042.1 hypothetical protein [Spongiibacter thalassae]
MNTLSLDHRRQAIREGLATYLAEAELSRAITHWENRYADQPSLALQRYVADICQAYAIPEKRSTVLRSLIHAMGQLPAGEVTARAASTTAKTSGADALSQAFSALMLAMMAQLDDSQRHKIRIDYLAALRQQQLPLPVRESLQRWLGNRETLSLTSTSNSLLQTLLNQFYVLLCERLGPVIADHILARGVRRVKEHSPQLNSAVNRLL